jgi:hypothetical protein
MEIFTKNSAKCTIFQSTNCNKFSSLMNMCTWDTAKQMQCVTTFCSDMQVNISIPSYGSIDNVNYIYRYDDYNITGRGTSFKLYCWGPKITASKETAKCKLHCKNAKWQNMPQILAGIAKYAFFWLFQCVLTFFAFSRYFAEVSRIF